jgi:RecA/RadA recombinase
MADVDASLLAKDIEKIKSRRKTAGPKMGDQAEPIERIRLDSPTMMRVTTGGIPMGRITRYYGASSSGKTHQAYLALAAAQKHRSKLFPKGLSSGYGNVEGIYDADHADRLGVDTKKLLLDPTQVIEEIAEALEFLFPRSLHFHVVDSTSDALSLAELSGDVADANIGIQSKAWKASIKRIEKAMGDQNALLLISHVGTKIDMQRRSSYTYPKDGDHLNYVSSMNLEFDSGGWLFYHPDGHLEKSDKLKEDIGLSPAGMKEPDGIEVTVRCQKNRTGRQHLSGKMRFDLNTFTYDTAFELSDAGTFFDEDGMPAHRSKKEPIIRKTGEKSSWYALPDGRKFQGEVGIRAAIDSDPELEVLIRNAMMAGH